jgi:hypothetical protein
MDPAWQIKHWSGGLACGEAINTEGYNKIVIKIVVIINNLSGSFFI